MNKDDIICKEANKHHKNKSLYKYQHKNDVYCQNRTLLVFNQIHKSEALKSGGRKDEHKHLQSATRT